jgi:hypothetical protein
MKMADVSLGSSEKSANATGSAAASSFGPRQIVQDGDRAGNKCA